MKMRARTIIEAEVIAETRGSLEYTLVQFGDSFTWVDTVVTPLMKVVAVQVFCMTLLPPPEKLKCLEETLKSWTLVEWSHIYSGRCLILYENKPEVISHIPECC